MSAYLRLRFSRRCILNNNNFKIETMLDCTRHISAVSVIHTNQDKQLQPIVWKHSQIKPRIELFTRHTVEHKWSFMEELQFLQSYHTRDSIILMNGVVDWKESRVRIVSPWRRDFNGVDVQNNEQESSWKLESFDSSTHGSSSLDRIGTFQKRSELCEIEESVNANNDSINSLTFSCQNVISF